ncbi:hypothetical protein AVEN_108691-1, partial [Araneus ventricosus]
ATEDLSFGMDLLILEQWSTMRTTSEQASLLQSSTSHQQKIFHMRFNLNNTLIHSGNVDGIFLAVLLLFSNGFRDYHFWAILHLKWVSGSPGFKIKSSWISDLVPTMIKGHVGLRHNKSTIHDQASSSSVAWQFGGNAEVGLQAQVLSLSPDLDFLLLA